MRCIFCLLALLVLVATNLSAQEAFLKFDAKTAKDIALSMRVNGRVGGAFDFRVTSTDRSYNYKLRVTWLTPEVIRATARLVQLRERLSDEETQRLVAEAQAAGDTVFLVEIDPQEGSGIIPQQWTALLMPSGTDPTGPRVVRGISVPNLRDVRALTGAAQRDYAYDVFWVVFPLRLPDGQPLLGESDTEAELGVQIYNKAGRVRWKIPDSIRRMPRKE